MAAGIIAKIKELEANEKIPAKRDTFLSNEVCSEVSEISALAEKHLITFTGECNWEEIQILNDAGYRVFAVEQDRYGWLLGAIHTKKGIITYG